MTSPVFTGRRRIYTDRTTEELADTETMLSELNRALTYHSVNAREIRYLQRYYLGDHPEILSREKRVRPDVDNKIVVDYAYSTTRDIVGYFLGKSVRYVQRGSSVSKDEMCCDDNTTTVGDSVDADDFKRKQVETLNHILDIENKAQVDIEVATDCSIDGVGYRGVFPDTVARNGTHLSLNRLNPETTFVVWSSGNVCVPMYAVSYWENNPPLDSSADKKTFISVYTQRNQYLFETSYNLDPSTMAFIGTPTLIEKKDIDFGGYLPIVEYRNNGYAIGDWEMALSIMDGIDAVASDGVNDIQQFVENILVAIGMEFDEQTQSTLNNVGVLNIPKIPQGMPFAPVLEYISPQLDPNSGIAMREFLEATFRVIVGVPDRKTRGGGGGDTGDAVYMRDGWQDIDLVAANKEASFIKSEREALGAALHILVVNGELEQGILPSDVEIKFNRNKTANLQSKVQVLQTLWNLLDPSDAMEISDLTTNPQDVIIRAEKYSEKRLERQLDEQKRVSEVAAQFDTKNTDVNTGSQKKSSNNSQED